MADYRDLATSGFHHRLEVVADDPDFAVAALDHYAILVWRRRIDVAGVRALALLFSRLHTARPKQKIGFITLIEEQCDPFVDSDVRQLMSMTLKAHNLNIGAATIVYEKAGFMSAVTRSIITAINLASRAAFPSEVTQELRSGIIFVTRELRDPTDERREGLKLAVDTMRGASVSREIVH